MKKELLFIMMTCAALSIPVSAEDTSTLSDDPYSFEALIDGELYSFPMTYSDFTNHGWICSEDESEEFSPYSYTTTRFKKGDLEVYTIVMNLGINTLPLSECDVAGISMDSYEFEKAPDTTFELPGGITYNKSTLDDITSAYGPATDTYEGELYVKLSYDYDIYQTLELYVDNETGVLNDIEIRNMDENKSATKNAEAVVSDEVPANVLSYTAPTELGDELSSYIVDYAGNLYQLPAPVSVFLENGWTLHEDSEEIVAGRSTGWVYIRKDNQEFHTLAKNYDENATSIENCFITSVESNVNTADLPMTIQKGITMGMTESDLINALDGIEYTLDDSSSSFNYYTIEDADYALDGIEILVNKEDKVITSIEVSHTPKTLE